MILFGTEGAYNNKLKKNTGTYNNASKSSCALIWACMYLTYMKTTYSCACNCQLFFYAIANYY
jgi:hypothetical protein